MNDAYARGRFFVCADDFGLNAPACDAAIELAWSGRISAISVLIDSRHTRSNAAALRQLRNFTSIGLHFNLTERLGTDKSSNAARSLQYWIWQAYMQPVSTARVAAAALTAQLDKFEHDLGFAPEFIDGHRHVHQLPGIGLSVAQLAHQRYGEHCAIRLTAPGIDRGIKASCIKQLGGSRMLRTVNEFKLAHNKDFAGVYDFSTDPPYAFRMKRWISELADGGLIMCHPQVPDQDANPARVSEYLYLRSEQWRKLLASCSLTLAPFRTTEL
ncbi:MAG: ChbG/HpnK family deacetylase [Steroidobacteraceae bacterium]